MLYLVGLFLLVTFGYVIGECNSGCNEPTLLYEDLGCKPVFASPTECCPFVYDCSHIEPRNLVNDKCFFHGKVYNEGESINDDEVYGNCQVGCKCTRKRSGNMGFSCAAHHCSEWLGRRPQYGCHLKYELDECCNVGEACPPFSTTCLVHGRTYHEGQTFTHPTAKCTECVCQKGFEGKFEAPFCKKRECNQEIEHQKDIKTFCAPSYLNNDQCCPHSWICPKNDNIVHSRTRHRSPNLKCRFGDSKLNVGDRFTKTTNNGGRLQCQCRIPPFLTCTQNAEYPSYIPDY